jgi:hypothetical protein
MEAILLGVLSKPTFYYMPLIVPHMQQTNTLLVGLKLLSCYIAPTHVLHHMAFFNIEHTKCVIGKMDNNHM